jgi:hypothetical protein
MVDRLMSLYGPDIGLAYDIGCAFETTLHNSSLGPRAKELNLRMMVGSFHGHAHNCQCQLTWHPLHIVRAGHSEGEGCEHIFSSSNDQARLTRHSTQFHRHQSLEEHFTFWDHDKYAALGKVLQFIGIFSHLSPGNFLFNHYRDALSAIGTLEAELEAFRCQFGISDADFERYFLQEKAYLEGLKTTPPEVTLKIQYVRGLNMLNQIR